MKDLNFNVDELKQTLNENEDKIKIEYDAANIKVLKEYLIQQTNSTFTFDEIYFYTFGTQNDFEDALTIGCMQGSALGCCGNYEGCCWFANAHCLVHDLICLASGCDPEWFCGGDCN